MSPLSPDSAVNAAGSQGAPPATSAPHPNSPAKSQEPTKNNKTGQASEADEESADVDIPDMDIPDVQVRNVPGGIDIIKTVKGKTTVTHVNTGPRVGQPGMPDMEKALRGIDRSKLTPEQREKLRRLTKMGRPPGTNTPEPPDQPDDQ
jgi:hypothetical protein